MPDEITLTNFDEAGDSTQARAVLLGDLVRELVADAEAAAQATANGGVRGPITALPPLDRALNGWLRPGLHVITGEPGAGKSALALQIAALCKCPAIYLSAEQGSLELFRRIIAQTTNTALDDVRNADSESIRKLAQSAANKAAQVLMLDATSAPATVEQIIRLAASLRKRCEQQHILLVVDALQPWSRGIRAGAEYETIEAGLADLVAVTNRLRIPALVLSHRNRASSNAQGPNMTAAKGSASFEHMAESLWHLARGKDEEQDRYVTDRVRVNLGIAKNRHGQAGFSIRLDFVPTNQRFLIVI